MTPGPWFLCFRRSPLWNYRMKWFIREKNISLLIELLYDPAIPLLGVYLKKMKTLIRKYTCTPMFLEALFTIAKIWKQPKCPSTDERMKEMWYIHTMDCYSAIKKNEFFPFVTTWMDLEGISLSEISQTEKDKYCMYHVYMKSKK